MEFLFWFLELFPKSLVALVFFLVIIVLLEAASAPSTVGKESLYKQKNGVEDTKLDDKALKVGAAKKSNKKKRVKFVDDVAVAKVDHFEGSEKPIDDFELSAASAPSTVGKESLYKQKNGVEDTKLDDKALKVGAAKKSNKKKRVKFLDDVVVAKVDHFEGSEKPIDDFELSVSEKVGYLNKSLDGGIERGEASKIKEDADDVVVVRKVDHFEGSDKPVKVFELSEKSGFLDRSLDEGLGAESVEGSKIEEEFYQFEGEGGDKKSEVMLSGKKLVDECGDVNMIKDVKGADAEGKASKNVGLLVEALDRENEGAIIGDYCDVKGEDVVTCGLEGFVTELEITIDAIGGEVGLISMNDEVGVEECNAAGSERVTNITESFGEELQTNTIDCQNGLKFMIDEVVTDESDAATGERVADNAKLLEVLEREAFDDENGMALMNDDIVTDKSDIADGKEVANNGETLEEELKREAIDGENGLKLINGVVRIDESDAASGERVASKAEFLEELERQAVEGKREHTAGDLDKITGVGKRNIHLVSGGLEDLVVDEVIKSEEFGSESKVELVSDNVAYPLIEEAGAESVNVGDMIGTEEGSSKVNEGDECILRDKDVGDDSDDDWEGVERSELEKVFAEAVNYMEYGRKKKDDQLASLRSDVQMLLYGLHKLAVEGPCHVPQPMALKVSARAKWNAWQRLGSMSPEVAMEEYIKILSDADPGWTRHYSAEDDTHGSLETGVYGGSDTKLTSLRGPQASFEFGRKPEVNSIPDGTSLIEQTPQKG